jgi:hypothetical protein
LSIPTVKGGASGLLLVFLDFYRNMMFQSQQLGFSCVRSLIVDLL